MLLRISHTTTYRYDHPVSYALQQLRMRPKSRPGQNVINWAITVEGGKCEAQFTDQHANQVDLVSTSPDTQMITMTAAGEVEVTNNNGVFGSHSGFAPLWLFQRETPLTASGTGVKALVKGLDPQPDPLSTLHDLSVQIAAKVPYSTDQVASDLTAEDALHAGHGVCQDHAHIFISAARRLGFAARYVSGYLMMDDRIDQDASHAWAEVHLVGLGWVGFDVSNGISPDDRYVRLATGLDYNEAAPISGLRFGHGAEHLNVQLQVQQQ